MALFFDKDLKQSRQDIENTFHIMQDNVREELKTIAIAPELVKEVGHKAREVFREITGQLTAANIYFIPEASRAEMAKIGHVDMDRHYGGLYLSESNSIIVFVSEQNQNLLEKGEYSLSILEIVIHELGHSYGTKEILFSPTDDDTVAQRSEKKGFGGVFPDKDDNTSRIGFELEEIFSYSLEYFGLQIILRQAGKEDVANDRVKMVEFSTSGPFIDMAHKLVQKFSAVLKIEPYDFMNKFALAKKGGTYEQEFRTLLENKFGPEFYDYLLTLKVDNKDVWNRIDCYREILKRMDHITLSN